jgi:two-component system response regulator YesN
MYKLMVVDDEQIVIDAVTHIINKNIKNVTVVACARNGREAIEKVRMYHPEIVLMDIRMPGINGLNAISEIKKLCPDIRFGIISAYEQFEFAKQAMELGVEHYILKPINRTILINTILRMISQIHEEENKKRRELENIEKLERVVPFLEQGFIYSILMNNEFNEELLKYMNILNVDKAGGYIMIMQFGDGEKAENLSNRIGSSIIGQENYPFLRDIFKFKCNCIVGPVMVNKIIVYVSSEQFSDEYEFRLQTIELAENILSSVQKRMKMECFIGIGSYKKNNEISVSYYEAAKALRYNRGEPISHIYDICGDAQKFIHDNHAEYNLMKKIEMGDEEGAVSAFFKHYR